MTHIGTGKYHVYTEEWGRGWGQMKGGCELNIQVALRGAFGNM